MCIYGFEKFRPHFFLEAGCNPPPSRPSNLSGLQVEFGVKLILLESNFFSSFMKDKVWKKPNKCVFVLRGKVALVALAVWKTRFFFDNFSLLPYAEVPDIVEVCTCLLHALHHGSFRSTSTTSPKNKDSKRDLLNPLILRVEHWGESGCVIQTGKEVIQNTSHEVLHMSQNMERMDIP